MEYLKARLSEETIKAFGLGYSNKYSDDLYQIPEVERDTVMR